MSSAAPSTTSSSLSGRHPVLAPGRLVAELAPPPRFSDVRFDSYLPDPDEPSQAAAVTGLVMFADEVMAPQRVRRGPGRWFGRRQVPQNRARGVYLDGGFGVGKTHLLAALWHATDGPKAFGTFVELTHLVGALGFADTVDALGAHRLLCIDEFELDDPGDTVLISTLLNRLAGRGVWLAATSNTLPDRLGAERFAAQDFIREIQALADRFEVVTIDGQDYRARGGPDVPEPRDDAAVDAAGAGPGAALDDFPALLAHLATIHPSRYGALLDGVRTVCWRSVVPVADQASALRLVVLADRLYDRAIPLVASGVRLDQLFSPEMLAGGYRKKYLRALSRLTALAGEGATG